jgi:DHA1 family bicyclomycin/chloramphenicol resistance-like MFS transporter
MTPAPLRSGRLELLLILGALAAFGSLSVAMYLPGLPAMAVEFGGSAAEIQNTVAAFAFGLCLGQLAYGPASDRWGRRGPLLIGVGLYCLASLACLMATTLEALVAFRFIQGLGGCAGMVISRAIVRDHFPPSQAAGIYSSLMLIIGVAPILSPLAGGWIIAAFGWRAVFWCLLAFAVLIAAVVLFRLGETSTTETRVQAAAENPFAGYWALLGNRQVMAFVLCGGFASAGTFIYMAQSAHLIIEVYGVATTAFGWVYGAGSFAVLIGSQINRWLLRHRTSRALLVWSTRLNLAASLLLLGAVYLWPGALLAFVAPLCLAFLMNGLSNPNTSAEAMAASGWRAGSVAAMLGFSQFGLGAAAASLAGMFSTGAPFEVALMLSACSLGAMVCVLIAGPTPARPPHEDLELAPEAPAG